MINGVSKECSMRNNKVCLGSQCKKLSTIDSETIENKAKDTHFGTNNFYNTRHNNINISDLRKKRLMKTSVCLDRLSNKLDANTKPVTRSETISRSKKGVNKRCKQGFSSNRKIDSKKQAASSIKTRLAAKKKVFCYDFCSSSVENSGSSPCSAYASANKKEVERDENEHTTTKKFFTSRPTIPDSENKLPMMIFKGRHFHLAFARGLDKKAPVMKKHTKLLSRKRNKAPLPVSVKVVEKVSKIKPKVQSHEHLSIKPVSVALTRLKFPLCDNAFSEDGTDKENKSFPVDVGEEEQINSLPVMDKSPLVPEETTKENVDPTFCTSTPLKSNEHLRHILGTCSPMKETDTNVHISRSIAVSVPSSQLPLRRLVYDGGALSNDKTNSKEMIKFLSRKDAGDPLQLIIDAGQKNLGAKQCTICYMLYTPGDLQDEKTHKKYHESYVTKLKFPVWKKERILGDFPDGRVVMVMSSDAKYMLQKVKDIQQIVDKELGVSCAVQTKSNASYILFVTMDHQVAGFVVVEKISQAYRVISSPSVVGYESPRKVLYSERESVPALCGICRLWTAKDYRRHKIATRMLDCLRCHFIFGYLLSTDDIAFMDPTIDGRQFVERYVGTPNYLIYFKTSAM